MINLSKPWPLGIRPRLWWLYLVILAGLIFALYWADHVVSVSANGVPLPVRGAFAWLTEWGESDWILIPALLMTVLSGVLALVIPKRAPKLALLEMTYLFAFIFIGVGLPGLIANLLKRAIGRARPELFDAVGSFSFSSFANDYTLESFPSGHATTALALAFVIGFLAQRWFPYALIFGLGIAVSRIIVGAHYPTDVLAGIVLGIFGAYAVRYVFALRGWGFRFKPNGDIEIRDLWAVRRLVRGSKRRQRKAE
jgi:membrane-associated phospholipid phosphatase